LQNQNKKTKKEPHKERKKERKKKEKKERKKEASCTFSHTQKSDETIDCTLTPDKKGSKEMEQVKKPSLHPSVIYPFTHSSHALLTNTRQRTYLP